MPDAILEQIYQLKSHPFPDIYEAPLDPRVDGAQIAYYFDLYDWARSPLLQKISPTQALDVFLNPSLVAAAEAMLVLITGSNQTGRESLRNLILHKIALATPQADRPPIVTELDLEEGNRAEIVKQIATMFMYTYQGSGLTAPAFEVLQPVFNNMTANPAAGDRSYYSGLFQVWKNLIKPHCKRPLVLSLRGIHQYNTLQVVFNSTRHLFKFIIVMTDQPSDAESCRKLLADERRNVGLIQSEKLDRAKAIEYVRWRLYSERVNPSSSNQNSLMPFSVQALDELYAEGPTFKRGEIISWHVEFLNKTLRRAFNDHYAELAEKMRSHGPGVLQTLDANDRTIRAEHIRRAQKAINKT
jgi:hypothetical protein